METQKGLFTKLGVFGAIAVTLALAGKRHISMRKDIRHRSDSDALVDTKQREFENKTLRPGVPMNDGETKYKGNRSSLERDLRTRAESLETGSRSWHTSDGTREFSRARGEKVVRRRMGYKRLQLSKWKNCK